MKNPKTTILGVLTIVITVANAAMALLKGTGPVDLASVIAAVSAGIGLITAADSAKVQLPPNA